MDATALLTSVSTRLFQSSDPIRISQVVYRVEPEHGVSKHFYNANKSRSFWELKVLKFSADFLPSIKLVIEPYTAAISRRERGLKEEWESDVLFEQSRMIIQ